MQGAEKQIQEAANILRQARNATTLSGAGHSAESGISTFRDEGGIWDRLDPAEVSTTEGLVNTLQRNPDKIIGILHELLDTFEQASPNPGHHAVARLEVLGILKTVITQNIDNLHQEAGSSDVLEIHGNLFRMRCLSCGRTEALERRSFCRKTRERLDAIKEYTLENLLSLVPLCGECRSMMRPDVVMFGEAVQDLPRAIQTAQRCDVMLVLGTSGVVYPAAYLPIEAKKSGASVIVINPKENPFAPHCDVYIPMKTGEALPAVVQLIES